MRGIRVPGRDYHDRYVFGSLPELVIDQGTIEDYGEYGCHILRDDDGMWVFPKIGGFDPQNGW